MYFTRGYTFHTYTHGTRRSTINYGIFVHGETDFYGVLQQILEVEYPGLLNLKCVLFKCDWYDPTIGRGVRTNNLGMLDVNANRKYGKFEPYVLASQAEQVSFLSYPRVREKCEMWLSVIKVNPRGRLIGTVADVAMQQERSTEVTIPVASTEEVIHIHALNREVEDIVAGSDEDAESDEFEESDDGVESDEHNEHCNDSENESD